MLLLAFQRLRGPLITRCLFGEFVGGQAGCNLRYQWCWQGIVSSFQGRRSSNSRLRTSSRPTKFRTHTYIHGKYNYSNFEKAHTSKHQKPSGHRHVDAALLHDRHVWRVTGRLSVCVTDTHQQQDEDPERRHHPCRKRKT